MKLLLKYHTVLFATLFLILSYSYLNMAKLNANFDEKLRDTLFDIRKPIPTSKKVIIIDIDEKSIDAFGQWPFSRIHMAQALANLTNAGAGIIGLDIIFSEYDRNSPSNMAKKLGVQGDFLDSDELLAKVISQTPTILGYYYTNKKSKNSPPQSSTIFDTNNSKSLLKFNHAVTNIPIISSSAYSSGFFNAFSNPNGTINQMPLIMQYNNKIYPSLALEMISIASQTQKIKLLQNDYTLYGLQLNKLEIPVDEHGFMRINFRGPKKSFKYLSFLDIVNGEFDAKDVAGNFILIGTSVTTLADLRATVYDLAMPGVEIHANVIDNILQGDFLQQPSYAQILDLILIFTLTLLLGIFLTHFKSLITTLIGLGFFIALYFLFYYLLFSKGLILNLFYPLIATLFTTIIAFFINYTKENEQKNFIRSKFAQKVSHEVVSDLLSTNEENFKAKQKEISIFFSDIRSFTTITEKLHSPQRVIDMLNLYFEPMTNLIISNKGTVDKFIGDAIMAYWNAPLSLDKHADYALKTALSQQKALKTLNKKLLSEFDISLEIGIGIHTGLAVIGEMGSHSRSDYTVIGDSVNLASRLEGLTKYFGVNILISQNTKQLLQEDYHIRYIASVIVKGKNEPIKIYAVLTEEEAELFQKVHAEYTHAFECYEKKMFEEAHKCFTQIEETYPHKLNKIYIDKVTELQNPDGNETSTDFIMLEK